MRYTEGGDEKERKKSPLVSGPQRQHGEPSCHPGGIKGPSVVSYWATNMLANLRLGPWVGPRVQEESEGIKDAWP